MPKQDVQEWAMQERIISFLRLNTNFTLATSMDNVPHCANCFYAFDPGLNAIVFKSDPQTIHVRQALMNNRVAGSITADKLDRTKIQGIQFLGNFMNPGEKLAETAKKVYYGKFPLALAFSGNIWLIELAYVKMTDNTLGFGTKIEWKK